MMFLIKWTGKGDQSILIVFGPSLLVIITAGIMQNLKIPVNLNLACIIAGIIFPFMCIVNWFYGRKLNTAEIEDEYTGEKKTVWTKEHTLYSIPMEFISPISVVLVGIFILFVCFY
jgi:hypothetical protein